jgi:hypothetical protein
MPTSTIEFRLFCHTMHSVSKDFICWSDLLPQQLQQTRNIPPLIHSSYGLPSPNENAFQGTWGHFPKKLRDSTYLRVVFPNPQGLNFSTDYLSTEDSLIKIASLGAGDLCLAETNTNWEHPVA